MCTHMYICIIPWIRHIGTTSRSGTYCFLRSGGPYTYNDNHNNGDNYYTEKPNSHNFCVKPRR